VLPKAFCRISSFHLGCALLFVIAAASLPASASLEPRVPPQSGSAPQNANPALTNEDVVKMVQANLSTDIIVEQIRTNACSFSLSTNSLIKLKQANVPDKIISAMQAKNAANAPTGRIPETPNRAPSGGTTAGRSSPNGSNQLNAPSSVVVSPPGSQPTGRLVGPFGGTTLDAETYSQLNDTDRLDLNLIHNIPSALEDGEVLRDFVMLNNCQNRGFLREMGNEIDYPQIARFYKDNASQILADLPSELVFTGTVKLGQYNTARGVFPLQKVPSLTFLEELASGQFLAIGSGQLETFESDVATTSATTCLGRLDLTPGGALAPDGEERFAQFRVTFKPLQISEIRVSEPDARKFIEEIGDHDRLVYMTARMQITQGPPRVTVERGRSNGHQALPRSQVILNFTGQIQEVSVTRMSPSVARNNTPLTILRPDTGSAAMPTASNPIVAPEALKNPDLQQAAAFLYKKQYDQAFPISERLCTDGNQDGCAVQGILYAHGLGVAADGARGLSLMTKSCDSGSSIGCELLGLTYAEKEGPVALDYGKSLELLTKSCDGGFAVGCVYEAELYLNGIGTAKDTARAWDTFDRSCTIGMPWFSMACEAGDAGNCKNVGRCYSRGVGVAKDPGKMKDFFSRACTLGDQAMCAKVSQLH
jgi:hypothetical protein